MKTKAGASSKLDVHFLFAASVANTTRNRTHCLQEEFIMSGWKKSIAVIALVLPLFYSATALQAETGQTLYPPITTGAGNGMTVAGSGTQAYIAAGWGVEFKRLYPSIQYNMSMAGSSSAPSALLEGSADAGFMSRRMKEKEIAAFEKKYGYKPTELRVALDAVAVYVHKTNPLQGLTLAQVDAIFSSGRKCGYAHDIRSWRQLITTGEWADQEIILYGRDKSSGTRELFQERVLCQGEYKPGIQTRGSAVDTQVAVANNKYGMTYSGIGHAAAGVRPLPIALKDGEPFIMPTDQNVANGKYPLARYLYLYVNKAPGKPLPGTLQAYLKVAYSPSGQAVIENDGFIPLASEVLAREREKF
jgi:phosphate transport system substrate-binding protein